MKPIRSYAIITFLLFLATTTSRVSGQEVPAEARRHLVRGQTAVEMATTDAAFEQALSEFGKAIELAPNWPDPYYQLGLLQDKLGQYDEALTSLKRYLTLAPDSGNTAQVQDLYYKIEYRRDSANQTKAIVEALTSGIVRRKGGSPGGICVVKGFCRVEKEIKANIWCMVGAYSQTVPVAFDGSVFKFRYMYYMCVGAPSLRDFPCPWEVSIEAEVVATSPLRLRTKETWIQQYGGHQTAHYEGEWDLQPQ
jgi:tetratricopeptide (TPR) repeat protein